MQTLNTTISKSTYIIGLQNEFSLEFKDLKQNEIIQASLHIKKNILILKDEKNMSVLENLNLENIYVEKDFIFIPQRFKKRFKGLELIEELF